MLKRSECGEKPQQLLNVNSSARRKKKKYIVLFMSKRGKIFYVLQLIEINEKHFYQKNALPWKVEEMNMSSE